MLWLSILKWIVMKIAIRLIAIFFIFVSVTQAKHIVQDVEDLNYAICDNDADCIRVMHEDKDKTMYNALVENYSKHKPSLMEYNEKPLIPKTMHQIWFNPPVPVQYMHYLDECKKLHPDWKFVLWDSESIKKLDIDWQVFEKIRGYPGRADVVRMAIMYEYGGVYRDMDTKCLRPLDDLNHMYESFFSTNVISDKKYHIEINNSLLGSKAENAMIKRILNRGYERYLENIKLHDHDGEFDGNHALAVHSFMRSIDTEMLSNAGPKDALLLPHVQIFDFKRQFRRFDAKLLDVLASLFVGVKPVLEIGTHADTLVISQRDDLYAVKHWDLAAGFSPSVKKYIKRHLPTIEMQKYKTFMSSGALDSYSYRNNSTTPQIIHFVILNDDEQDILNENLSSWKLFNPTFKVKVWDLRKNDNFVKHESSDADAHRLFSALQILNLEGGIYINYRYKAKRGVFEIVNKFDFAGSLSPLNRLMKQVNLSSSMISSAPGSDILSSALSNIHKSDSYEIMLDKLTFEAYQKLSVGKHIVLPGIYFDPVDENRSKETLYDRVYRTLHGYQRLFKQSVYYSVVY